MTDMKKTRFLLMLLILTLLLPSQVSLGELPLETPDFTIEEYLLAGKDPAFSLIDPIEDFEYYFSLYPGTTIEKPDNSRIFYCEVNGQESIIPAMGAYVTPGEYTAFVSKDGHYDGKSIYGYTLQTFSVTENPDRPRPPEVRAEQAAVPSGATFTCTINTKGAQRVLPHIIAILPNGHQIEYDWIAKVIPATGDETVWEGRVTDETDSYVGSTFLCSFAVQQNDTWSTFSDPVEIRMTDMVPLAAPVIHAPEILAKGEDFTFFVDPVPNARWYSYRIIDEYRTEIAEGTIQPEIPKTIPAAKMQSGKYILQMDVDSGNEYISAQSEKTVIVTENAQSIKDFVSRCYQLILNREPDEAGLQSWSGALAAKSATAAQIIDGFIRSDEFTNRKLSDEAKVDILYKTMLNRAADAGGKAGWVDALSKGYTLQHIINGFCGSAEFKALCQKYGIEPGTVEASAPVDANTPRGKIEAFVKRCYQLILNRTADDSGLKGWSDALEGRTAAAAQIIDGFVRSPEYINRSLTSDQSVTILYKTMLDRDPDEGGKAGWVDALSKGYTLQHIINGFCGSAEFTKICSDYGIQAGSVAVPAKAAAAALTPEELPPPFELNVEGKAQPFEMKGIGGETISSESLSGKTTMLVFGRITCPNTQAFLSGISNALPLLREKGVQVLVGLADNPSDAEIKAFSDQYGSVRCAASSNMIDNGMWNNMDAIGADIVSVTFPVIFLKDANDYLRYYSTGYVKSPLRVVSTALNLAGAELPEPRPEPEIVLTADRTVAAVGQEITFTYESYHIDDLASPYVQWKVYEYSGGTSELVNRSLNWRSLDGSVVDNNVSDVITHTVTNPEVDRVIMEALLIDDMTIVGSQTVSVIIDNAYINSQIEAFVTRCYQLILNREPDAGGLQGWCDALQKKTAAAANIIDGFVKSDEFTNRKLSDDAKVDILYKTMLNREADAGGKAGWVDALSKGYTLQNIIDGFCGSAEFTAMCKDYGIEPGSVGAAAPTDTSTPRGKIEAFVKRCYQLILNRQADEGGLKGWSDALEGKTAAAAQIIDGFVRSPEYINRSLTSDQSVTILYKTMLDREPDEGGKAGWVDALGKGNTLQHIINGFCGSAEFTKICSDYGIQAGSVAVPVRSAAVLEAAAQLEAKKLPDERIGNAVSADDAGITVVNGYEPAEVEAFVKHAYRAALGREADEGGLASWTEQIVSGAVAPKAFLRMLLFSDEQIARQLNNEQFIEMLYRLYLNRGTDDAAADRVAQLAAGGLDEVIKGFEGSAEFRLMLNGFGL